MKNRYEAVVMTPIAVEVATGMLYTSIKVKQADVEVDPWTPVEDVDENDYFKVSFE